MWRSRPWTDKDVLIKKQQERRKISDFRITEIMPQMEIPTRVERKMEAVPNLFVVRLKILGKREERGRSRPIVKPKSDNRTIA